MEQDVQMFLQEESVHMTVASLLSSALLRAFTEKGERPKSRARGLYLIHFVRRHPATPRSRSGGAEENKSKGEKGKI